MGLFLMDKLEVIDGLELHQKELKKVLNEKNEKAAQIYIGALLILKQIDNPDRIALCAHGLRELIVLLPKFIDVPIIKEAQQQLAHFADALVGEWNSMKAQNKWPGDPPWNGAIDDHLRKVLNKASLLVESHLGIREGRRNQVKEIIKKQNFSAVPLPETIEDLKAKEWNIYRDYFAKIAHHASTTEEEFLSHVTHFENLLLNYLKPRTFDTHSELLTLIAEVQGD